jgi:hypothetical protein
MQGLCITNDRANSGLYKHFLNFQEAVLKSYSRFTNRRVGIVLPTIMLKERKMAKARKFLGIVIAVILLAVASLAAASVDLSGEYWFGSLSADVSTDVPWGERGTVVVTGDNWSQEWDDQNGHHTFSSTFTTTLQPDGSINIDLSSGTYNVAWNGDVMIHADAAPNANNRLGVDIIARKATDPQNSDVVGSYAFFGHHLNSFDGSDSDGWGNAVFKANGTTVIKQVNDQGHKESFTFNWTLDGISSMLNIQGQTSPNGLLLGKGGIDLAFQVLPSEGIDNDLGYNVFIKKTSHTITSADIAGTYQVRFLESGPGGVPYTCGRGTFTARADGTYSIDAYYSDSEHDVKNGSYKVGPGNKIMLVGGIDGIISPDKNLIFVTEYHRPAAPSADDWIGGIFLIKEPNSTPILQFGNLSGTKNTKLAVNDACNVLVTFSLTGGGYGEVIGANFGQINLYNTGDKSQLTITSKTETSIGDINSNGPLKGITAKTAELSGSITIGHSSTPKAAVTIAFDRANGLDINSQMPIQSLTATEWLGGSINTPSVGSITIKGDKKRGLSGDLYDVNVILSQLPDVKIMALGKLTVNGWIDSSQILSQGNIGAVTADAMRNSVCFAGVADAYLVDVNAADGVLDLPPVLDDTFNQTATIKSIAIKGIKGEDPNFFINSNIAAKNVSSIYIAYPQYNNTGVPFGITMWDNPAKSLTIKDDEGKHTWKGSNIGSAIDMLLGNGGDMQIRRD